MINCNFSKRNLKLEVTCAKKSVNVCISMYMFVSVRIRVLNINQQKQQATIPPCGGNFPNII